MGFSLFGWERGLVYYYLLENCGATAFLHLCQLSYAWTISRQILQRISSNRCHSYLYRGMLSRFWLILSRVCLWGQPHVPAFVMPYIRKRKILLRFFSVHALQPSVKANINFNERARGWDMRKHSHKAGLRPKSRFGGGSGMIGYRPPGFLEMRHSKYIGFTMTTQTTRYFGFSH